MQHHQDWSIQVLNNPIFQQIAPLVAFFFIPLIVFLSASRVRRLNFDRVIYSINKILAMVLGISLPWLWGAPQKPSSSNSRIRKHRRKSSSAKVVRTRAEQIPLQKTSKEPTPGKATENSESDFDDIQYYPGLVNISGTYCFMNSTLQAMASLSYLQPHIDAIHARAEAFDVPTPVLDALQELFRNLNTPKSSYHSLRPHNIIHALSSPQPHDPNSTSSFHPRTSSSLFNSREHQDAQELFQLISECVKNEMAAVDREGLRDRGIAGVLELGGSSSTEKRDDRKDSLKLSNKSVFDGLTANRRSCVMCGYTEAVMHFGFDNWQLAVPRLATSCRLEDCLEDYTRLEILKDCICRKCSVLATHKRLLAELKTLEEALAPPSTPLSASLSLSTSTDSSITTSPPSLQKTKPSQSKKKRYKEVKKMEHRVRTALDEGRIEEETLLEGVRLEKVVSPASTKQAMIARPPPVLALHLNRSVHYGQYAAKNTIRVHFPEVLDLTPFTTSGSLSTIPTNAISTPSPTTASTSVFQDKSVSEQPRRPTTPTQETYTTATQRTIYRLAAVVCHYGQHSFGHYICYRRKPKRGPKGEWVPPTLVDPLKFDEVEEGADEGVDGDVETETDGDGTLRLKKGTKANGNAKTRPSAPDFFELGGPKYYWGDHSETEGGTSKGWLRISDDSVEECGIERVLAEASGAFMLYYERAVHPKAGLYSYCGSQGSEKERGSRTPNGDGRSVSRSRSRGRSRSRSRSVLTANGNATESEEGDIDADGFSIGSEETLKPQLKVMDLNGSVGSLISEVGVGVLKKEKTSKAKVDKVKDKAKGKVSESDPERMIMSLYSPGSSASSSKSIGARVIRNVSAGRRTLPSKHNGNGFHPSSSSEVGSSPPYSSDSTEEINSPAGGDYPPHDMIASAPSILHRTSSSSRSTSHKRHNGFGSKSTRIIHQPPLSPSGVKAR